MQDHLRNFFDFLTYEKRYSHHTITSYRNDLIGFVDFLKREYEVVDISEVDHQLIRSWIVFLGEQGLVPRSVNRKITSLKTFIKYLLKSEVLDNNPMEKVISPKSSKKLPEFVGQRNMDCLLDEVEFEKGYVGTRDKLILELFYYTGMRLSELVNLTIDDVDPYNQSLKVLGKRNKERIIPMSGKLLQSIKAYLKERDEIAEPGLQSLFTTDQGKKVYNKLAYRVVNKYLSKVTTLDKKSPHVLRHTFATHMLNNGADINAVKELLGHASLSATQVYTHNTIEKLKKVYKQAHPRA